MSINPDKISELDLDKARIDSLLQQYQLLDATELIANMGHCHWDYTDNRLISCSEGYARIFNMSVEEVLDFQSDWQRNMEQIYPEDLERYLAAYHAQQETGHYIVEYRFTRNDGEVRWLREVGLVQFDENHEVYDAFGILQDITENRAYEQDLQQARDSLEATVTERTQQLADTIAQLKQEVRERETISAELENKNTELERFTYTVSHDLKTPLVTIKGFLGLLERDLDANDPERVKQDMEKLNQAADTMGQLLEELLELSRIGHVVGDLVTCSLTWIAHQAIQMTEGKIVELGAEVTVENMPEMNVDRIRLTEVYQNLVENALKFMGDQPSPRIDIGSTEKNGKPCFFVRDNGIGVAPEYHDLVFGLFERLNMDIEGTGVGLALVKRIIDVHGGNVWVESKGAGQGTTVFFTLPES